MKSPIDILRQWKRRRELPLVEPEPADMANGLPHQGMLRQQVALVTGGSGLLGSAICRRLAANGARVVVHYYRREAEARHVTEEIQRHGGSSHLLQADIREQAQVRAMFDAVSDRFGSVYVLVNNASTIHSEIGAKGFLEHSWGDYQQYIDTVLRGTFHCCQAVLPSMIQRRAGRIINIGTTALNEINSRLNPYVTAKGGLLGMSRSLAEEFGKFNITVNVVAPGYIWPNAEREPAHDEGREYRDRSPLGRGLALPSDVAGTVVFLASDLANSITGAYLPVCAGQITTG